jgi:hypothetical protein
MKAAPFIKPASPMTRVSGWRSGTAFCTLADLRRLFGEPTYDATATFDGKVTASWVFITPRGPAEVRDYWWNPINEQSIAAGHWKATFWLSRFLREHGIKVQS